jgi:orotate phosphoribosyltransferase
LSKAKENKKSHTYETIMLKPSSPDKDRLLSLLIREAFFKEKITLSSGKVSDFYIDARRVTLTAEGAYLCAKVIWDLLQDEPVDAIGGPTLGADPLVGAIGVLSFQARKPINTFLIRKTPKSHGKKQLIEGPPLKPGCRAVLIDDVATTGQALVGAVEVLSQMGVKANKAVCLVDRAQGAEEALAGRHCELISIFNLSDFPV